MYGTLYLTGKVTCNGGSWSPTLEAAGCIEGSSERIAAWANQSLHIIKTTFTELYMIAYHLFKLDFETQDSNASVKLSYDSL